MFSAGLPLSQPIDPTKHDPPEDAESSVCSIKHASLASCAGLAPILLAVLLLPLKMCYNGSN